MTFHAYIDESEPSGRVTYRLSCALVDKSVAADARAVLVGARRAGERKVHWHDRTRAAQLPLVRLVADLPVLHLLVVRDDHVAEPGERRRRKCLGHLLWLLDDSYGVHHAVLEARQSKQNANDLQLLQAMRAARRVGAALRMHHVPGPQEPLLWIPDIVAGAFNAGRAGDAEVYAPIAELIDVRHTPA